ncbi:MAG: hypothetical protein IT244_06185 [Bacteroidia bacterium]|nr:hypothetical protein [Bacteroidia bacterium]
MVTYCKWILVTLLLLVHAAAFSQTTEKPAPAAHYLILRPGAGMYLGLGDLGKRFDRFASTPINFYYKAPKYSFGLSWSPFLGNRVRIDSLYGGILGESQIIYDKSGNPGLIRYYMRGFTVQGKISKFIPVKKSWKYSQFEIGFGTGFMQHRIKAKFDVGSIPQLEGEYKPGYDRLTNGIMFSQCFNFHYLNTETVSFYAGIELGQGFTKNQRKWDYGTIKSNQALRTDLYTGISAGIIIPLRIKSPESTDYYE